MIIDEIQLDFGWTGKLFIFEDYQLVPDILMMGKGIGGCISIGVFIVSQALMQCLTHNPVLCGYITRDL